jgi:tetratricopeptide (TPR) repeat protein
MTRQKHIRRWALAAVVALAGWGWFGSGRAVAQYRVGNDGHALDANNRIGSNGYNSSSGADARINETNDIVLGNVTGLAGFKGSTPDANFFGFNGLLSAQPSWTLQQESGNMPPYAAPTYNQSVPFYTYQTAAFQPPGFQQEGSVYQPAPPPQHVANDYRLGNTLDQPVTTLPKIGDTTEPGPVDPTASLTPTYLNASPIYGVRQLAVGPDGNISSYYYGDNLNKSVITDTLSSGLTAADVARMRDQLLQNKAAWQTPNQPPLKTSPLGNPNPAAPGNTQAINPVNVAQAAQVQPGVMTPSVGSDLTGQGQQDYLTPLPTPAQQSPQYAKLQALLAQYQAIHPQTAEQANDIFYAELRAQRAYEESLNGGSSSGGLPAQSSGASPVNPNPTPTANPTASGPAAHGPALAPVQINSIGKSIQAEGLSQLLQQGEALARKQQFKDAIARFLEARQVAPNNQLILIDLANADLGAGFYEDANNLLREAFTDDPALLMGRYDLKSTLSDQRMQEVISDLKRIASAGNSPLPVVLLAYVSYNSGDTAKALQYLDLAQTRAGGNDAVIRSLHQHWSQMQPGGAATSK